MIDQRALISPQEKIVDAIARLNSMSVPKFVLVVDETRKLLGTITDGDIRRAILKGVDLSMPVSNCMNLHPITIKEKGSGSAWKLLKAKQITFIPIVTDSGELLDVVTNRLSHFPDVFVVLMAGGLGSRLQELTCSTPKSLLMVSGRPILARILKNLEAAGVQKIYIAVNHLADQIIHYFSENPPDKAEIHFLKEDQRLGTAGPLSLLPSRPTSPFIVANADLVTEIDFEALIQFQIEHQFHATVGAATHIVDIPYGVLDCDDFGHIKNIREKPRLSHFVNGGVYVLTPQVWDLIPPKSYLDMPDLINDAISHGLKVVAFPIHEYWLDVGRHHDLERAHKDWPVE